MKTKSPLLRLDLHQSGLLLAALALLAAPQAQAQLYTGSGSTGFWNTSRWSTDTNGSFTTAWGSNSNAVFLADTAYTFTGAGTGTPNIGNVTVESGASVVFSARSGTLGTGGNVRTLDVGTNAILDFTNNNLSTAAGTGFIKTGDGVYATGGGTYQGGFTLNGGTVVLRSTDGLGGGATNVLTVSSGVVAANANRSLDSTRFGGGIRIAGNFQLGALSNSYATNAQALILGTANISFANDVSLQGANRTITLGGNGNGEFSGVISDGGLTVTAGAGVTSALLKLTGASANTYTGLTTVSAGDLTLSKTAAVDAIAGNALVDGTGTLTLGAANQINNASDVEVAAGTFALATFDETVNGVKLTGGTITGTTGVLTSSTAYDFQSSGNVTGILAGTAGANKTTAGTVTFSGGNANTYTGLTTVSAGSLVLNRTNNADSLAGDVLVNGTGTLAITKVDQIKNAANLEVATGGTFALGGNTDTVNGVKLTGGAITGTGVNGILTSATAYDLQSGSSSAVLAGTAGATKTTAGTVTLTKANTYSGGTALSDGTLQLGNNTALGTGTVALNGGTLSSDDTANRTILNAVTVGGNVVLGDATNDGKLNFSAGVDLGAGDRTLTTASSVAFNGAVSGSGGITKAGSATLTLSTTNSYLGNTVLVQGSLIINGNQSSATGALTVASGATLGGSGTIGGATTISGIHSPGNSPGVQTFNNGLTYSNGSTFVWELITNGSADRGTAFDGVNVSGGTLTINGGVTNNLVFNGAGSTVNWSDTFWASNQQWLVFDNASFPTVSSNVFDTINVGVDSISQSLTSVRSGSSFSWDTIDDNLYLTYAIPEPSTCALLALLGAGFAGRALVRRRRRHEVN